MNHLESAATTAAATHTTGAYIIATHKFVVACAESVLYFVLLYTPISFNTYARIFIRLKEHYATAVVIYYRGGNLHMYREKLTDRIIWKIPRNVRTFSERL